MTLSSLEPFTDEERLSKYFVSTCTSICEASPLAEAYADQVDSGLLHVYKITLNNTQVNKNI